MPMYHKIPFARAFWRDLQRRSDLRVAMNRLERRKRIAKAKPLKLVA